MPVTTPIENNTDKKIQINKKNISAYYLKVVYINVLLFIGKIEDSTGCNKMRQKIHIFKLNI